MMALTSSNIVSLLHLDQIFPSVSSVVIFFTYMVVCLQQALLVTASRTENEKTYPYNPATVVMLTEVVKLVLAFAFYIKSNSLQRSLAVFYDNKKLMIYYMVPSLLYCMYNNLSFKNLSHFDPTTYLLLLQSRLLMTGIIYQFLFKKKLSTLQWIALVILTAGCIIQRIGYPDDQVKANQNHDSQNVPNNHHLTSLLEYVLRKTEIFWIILQVSCSVFAGVYNEYIIKRVAGENVNIMLHNCYMYVTSIVCNVAFILFQQNLFYGYSENKNDQADDGMGDGMFSFLRGFNKLVIAIVMINASIGIMTSLFIKTFNSVLKTFVSAIELMLTAILSFLIFGIPIYWNTVVAIFIVSTAILIYAMNPIQADNKDQRKNNSKVDIVDNESPTKRNLLLDKQIDVEA